MGGMDQRGGSIAFDRVADDYDRTRGGAERGAAAAAAVLPLLPPAGPVLEVGVGTGLVAAELTAGGRQVAGLDLSLPMLRQAVARLPGRVVAADGTRLPVRTGSVGAVVFIHVLHLVGDLPAALSEAARVLLPGGRVVASVSPQEHRPDSDVAEVLWERAGQLGRGDHLRDDYRKVLDAVGLAGLALVDRSGYYPSHLGLSPAEAIDRIGTRSASWMWNYEDDVWAGPAEAATEALRRLPDQTGLRPASTELPLLVFAASG